MNRVVISVDCSTGIAEYLKWYSKRYRIFSKSWFGGRNEGTSEISTAINYGSDDAQSREAS